MFSELALQVDGLGKTYHLYERPIDRLKQLFAPHAKTYYRAFTALERVTFELRQGEVLGIVGTNGSGKSTLLQLICKVLEPTSGSVKVKGRIAALLELGAGFNPEFSGRENIYLNATILGLSAAEIESKIEGIIDFSGVRDFIDQPVKTYSSGMYVRLAFSIATSVEPDILIIDEALSVGDGAFARKSFDRIMQLKGRGATILFCSHNIYQVEALCQRVLWLDKGQVRALGESAAVCQKYNQFLEQDPVMSSELMANTLASAPVAVLDGTARIVKVEVLADGNAATPLQIHSMVSTLEIKMAFSGTPGLPSPTVAVIMTDASGRNITSCSTHYDKFTLQRDSKGAGQVVVAFPRMHLLRGVYVVHVFLMCEQAIHIYDSARCAEFSVVQSGLEIGIVALQREWSGS